MKMNLTSEFGSEFEKSYLLLAGISVATGKNDIATEMCQKCLANNKSCAKV